MASGVDTSRSVRNPGSCAALQGARAVLETNVVAYHLDIDTKAMLVKVLAGFEGTLPFVSHDRKFLSALSNRVLELKPEGTRTFGGGYDEYVAESGQEAPGLRI